MKTNYLKMLSYLTVLSLLFISNNIFADDFTKVIEQQYNVDATKCFKITNKFGKIHIENWDSDKLSITVTITVDASNQEKADDFFEKISINFSEVDTLISAITDFESTISNSEFSIDYKIFMPKYLKLNLLNSYGDVYIHELTGKSLIEVKFGSLIAEKLIFGESKPRSGIILSYSTATIKQCDWLKLQLSFSEINITESEALIIKSKYSDINVTKANSIVTDSKYDNPFEIEELENFVCEGEYSDYKIGKLKNILKADLKYCNLEISDVSNYFTSCTLIMSYGNATIDINDAASYKIKADSEYGNITFPEGNNISENSDKSLSNFDGYIGTDKTTKSTVTVDSKFADIEFE